MGWPEIQTAYPNPWLIIEALQAHTTSDHKRQLDQIAVIDTCKDGASAMQLYRRLHRQYPLREFYFVHTSRSTLDIRERQQLRIRRNRSSRNCLIS